MTPLRHLMGCWCALAVWSLLCAIVSQSHFTHVLFICEQVEALYRGKADDTIVAHVMQMLVAVIWTAGAGVIVLCWQIVGTAQDGTRK